MIDRIRAIFATVVAMFNDARTAGTEIAAKHGLGTIGRHAMTGAVIGFITIAATIGIGVYILYSINAGMPVIDVNNSWNATQVAVQSTSVSGMNLLVVVLIIIAAGVLLGAIRYFGGNSGGGGGM